jgi:DNA invertase Pin-like site-specific DNA recombinase
MANWYARVSTTDQDLSIQEAALTAGGCRVIRGEKRGGTTTEGREALRTVLEFLRAGDVLMVTRIGRLARSIGDLQDIVRTVRARGAVLKATEQPIDTGTAAGNASWTCWGCSPSSRRTCAASGSWKASRRRRLPASTKAGRLR